MTLSRNTLIALLAIAVPVTSYLAYRLYEERRAKPGIELQIGPRGLSIEQK